MFRNNIFHVINSFVVPFDITVVIINVTLQELEGVQSNRIPLTITLTLVPAFLFV